MCLFFSSLLFICTFFVFPFLPFLRLLRLVFSFMSINTLLIPFTSFSSYVPWSYPSNLFFTYTSSPILSLFVFLFLIILFLLFVIVPFFISFCFLLFVIILFVSLLPLFLPFSVDLLILPHNGRSLPSRLNISISLLCVGLTFLSVVQGCRDSCLFPTFVLIGGGGWGGGGIV